MKKTLEIFINTVLVLLIIVGLAIAFSLLPIKKNIKLLSVISGSMEPTISTGSLIIIRPAVELNKQDIISFNPKNAKTKKDIVTHRIIDEKTINGMIAYVTKGDANDAPDTDPVYKDQVLGKYVFSVALIGYALGFIKSLPGLLIIILIPSTIIVYEEAKKIKSEAKLIFENRKNKKNKKRKNAKAKS